MKVVHLEARAKIPEIDFDPTPLPDKVGLLTTVQFLEALPKLKDILERGGKTAIEGGQVLGCDVNAALKMNDQVDCFLYFGSGNFHPIGIAKKTGRAVFTLHPEADKLQVLDKDALEGYERRKRGQLAKFLSSDAIGVLLTKKSGQAQVQATLKSIFDLEIKYPKKSFYFFLSDTFNFDELENFPFIEAWINTACPRIEEDIRILNIEDIDS